MTDPRFQTLVDEAVAPYRRVSRFAHGFARGKLSGDPAFEWMLREGLLSGRRRMLDLGCGQGLLAALLLTADQFVAAHRWPSDWPAPPESPAIHGIELMPADVERASQALGLRARIVVGNMIDSPYSQSDAVIILDVLHYVDPVAQETVLDRVRHCLVDGGRLLLRVGDAAGGWRFQASLFVDHVVMRVRGHRLGRLYCRTIPEWTQALQRRGFRVEARAMSVGTPFANVLLIADLA